MSTVLDLVNIAVITYGAVYDAKYRIIPNMVPIIIMLTKAATGENLPEAAFSLVLIILCLGISHYVFKVEIPGGDFKLICSLTWNLGIFKCAVCLLLVFAIALPVCLIRKEKSFPLCTYTSPVFTAMKIMEMIY